MKDIKKDFPILKNNKNIVYLDSTATTQKPSYVIDWMKDYLENDYANIHRWSYSLSERSEKMYVKSKKKLASFINSDNWREIIYSFNSTYASNLLVWSLKRSSYFKKWDKVLVSIVEHHANIVPRLILAEEVWIEVGYINVKKDFSLDLEDLEKKLDSNVKAISITHVSNVTWEIFDLEKVRKIIDKKYKCHPELDSESLKYKNTNYYSDSNLEWKKSCKPLFIIDASQSFPHIKIDIKKLWCDFMFFTWHKFMADSWIWVLWWKKELLENLKPVFSWWWAISWVKKDCFLEANLPDRFEPWTPNLTWALSILKALEYIEQIWWYQEIEKIEKELSKYFLEKFGKIKWVKLIGWENVNSRVWVFSFIVNWIHSHDIADYLAEKNICIRAWQHCAEPLMWELWINHSCRASLYIYNTKKDIDIFLKELQIAINYFSNSNSQQ